MAKVVHVDSGPIGRTLFAFALPVLLSQMLQELYNAADCAVLGHFGESGALAASGIAGLLLSVFINFFIGFSSGVSAVTARQFGAGEFALLRRTMAGVFRLVFVAGALLSALGYACALPLLRALRCPAAVLRWEERAGCFVRAAHDPSRYRATRDPRGPASRPTATARPVVRRNH